MISSVISKSNSLTFWRVHVKKQLNAPRTNNPADLEELTHASSLYALADYLRTTAKIGVMHNADDIILGAGDIEFLRKHFADRLTLYPYGGHLGNLITVTMQPIYWSFSRLELRPCAPIGSLHYSFRLIAHARGRKIDADGFKNPLQNLEFSTDPNNMSLSAPP